MQRLLRRLRSGRHAFCGMRAPLLQRLLARVLHDEPCRGSQSARPSLPARRLLCSGASIVTLFSFSFPKYYLGYPSCRFHWSTCAAHKTAALQQCVNPSPCFPFLSRSIFACAHTSLAAAPTHFHKSTCDACMTAALQRCVNLSLCVPFPNGILAYDSLAPPIVLTNNPTHQCSDGCFAAVRQFITLSSFPFPNCILCCAHNSMAILPFCFHWSTCPQDVCSTAMRHHNTLCPFSAYRPCLRL